MEQKETARRIKQRIGVVIKWAIAQGWHTDNPIDAISEALPKHDRSLLQHRKAMPYQDVADCLAHIVMRHEHLKIDPILRKPTVLKSIGISNATLYKWMDAGNFPKPLQRGRRAIGWRTSVIQQWIDSRIHTDGKTQER